MSAIHTGSQDWDQVDPLSARESVPTVENLAATFPEPEVRHNPDMLLAQIGDQIIGYNHVYWRWTEITNTRVYLHLGYLLPEWRGKGIGSALLRWSQERIQALIREDGHEGSVTFATNVSSTEKEADRLIQQAGYTAVKRLSDMMLSPLKIYPIKSLPVEVNLQDLQPTHYHEIYRAWKDAFAATWTTTVESEEDYQGFLDDNINVPSFDPSLCRVAWVQNQVVGFVFARIRVGVGLILEVAVRKTWQRKGIARVLMMQVLNELHAREVPQVRLFTDAGDEHGARSLYEQLGFREVKQHIFYRKPIQL
jgi:GNAT superfamily N-acetyltransferase